MADPKRWVWVPDPKDLFAKALILGEDGDTMRVRLESNGETREIRASEVEKVNPSQFNQVGDMAELTYLNEPSVVHNLSSRWQAGKIYTYSGLFLVAVNPYKALPIYGSKILPEFKNKRRDEAEPHIYAVAEQALSSMLATRRDQSILITGESGAGKTENTKNAIQYLSSVTNSKSSGNIDERILRTNPILEAFGNAQTIRNANSSRFGKFIKIQFNQTDSNGISGASIQWYLLEKSRVVTQHENERNYHVFYQLLSGAPSDLKKKLGLPEKSSPEMFTYLAKGVPTIDGVDDAQLYARLVEAFMVMGFSTTDVENIMGVVASVLLLGQVKYRASSADQGSVVNMHEVEAVCRLLGVDAELFVKSIVQPRVKVGREFTTQSRTASQAQHTTNAVAKALYERLFGHIVEQLNARLGKSKPSSCSIGVLDIAGFEIFETNSFEQLCINYTNEKLQQFFNHHMFVLEQEEYVKENVDWDYIDYGSDLQPTIDLIEQNKNPMGIFSCLNEESVLPSGSDASFNEKLVQQWGDSNAKFSPSRLGQGFKIDHYAQAVEYDTEGWIEKNKDPLSDVVESLLAGSRNSLVRSLFANTESSKLKGKASLFRTVAQRHKEQLGDLMLHLTATQPHFVRCILPNTQRSPNSFENHLVLNQLRYNGVLEGIRIARSGFPNRLEFLEFSKRYRALAGHVSGPLDSQQTCASILQNIGLDTSLYKVGLSKIFFRNGVLADLEHRLERLVAQQTLMVQSLARGAAIRIDVKRQLHRRRAAKMIAMCFRLNTRHHNDPWWQLNAGLKPLLMSKEMMDSSKKDLRMQKLESSLHKMKEEQVELISSKNELRGELIAALKSKEELARSLEASAKEQKEREEAHELAVTAARARDEASSAALLELSKKHNSLREELEELRSSKGNDEEMKQEYESRIESLVTELTELKGSHKISEQQRKSLEQKMNDAISDHERAVTSLKSKSDKSEGELDKVNLELKEALKRLQQKDEENRQLEDKVTQDSKSKDSQLVSLRMDLSRLENELAKAKESHATEVAEAQAELADFKSKFADLESTNGAQSKDLNAAESNVRELQIKLDKSMKEVAQLRDWLAKAKTELVTAVETRKSLSELQEKHKQLLESSSSDRKKHADEIRRWTDKATGLETQLSGKVASDELATVIASKEKISRDLDISTDNLLKTSDELAKSKDETNELRSQLKKISSELASAKESLRASEKSISKLREALTTAESASQMSDVTLSGAKSDLDAANAALKRKQEELFEVAKSKTEIEDSLTSSKSKISELTRALATAEAKATSDSKALVETSKQLNDAKKELLKLRTQTTPSSGIAAASFSKRFGNANIEQELEDKKHALAESEAQVSELQSTLESARKENAKFILLRQKYEKLQREKAMLAQDRSHLMLGAQTNRSQSRELEIAKARAAEVKRLQSELNVLRLKLVRGERDRREMETKLADAAEYSHSDGDKSATSLQHHMRLLKIENLQLSKALHELGGKNLPTGSTEKGDDILSLGIPSPASDGAKRHPLQSVSNDKRIDDQAYFAAEHTKSADLEEAVEIYRSRASEFHTKLENAELVVESALRAEQAAKNQVAEYKAQLSQVKEDHNSEVRDFHRELQKTKRQLESRDAEIEDLAMKANFGSELQGQIKSLNSTLKELSVERDRLAKDKARLEHRLHDIVSSYELQPRQLQEQVLSLKQNEQQMMREHGELRWKLERKARHVDQLSRSLTDADARIEQCRAEIDRLQARDSAREIELRRANREISETNEKYLMAERELEQYRSVRRSTRKSVDTRPAFV